jgi:hypothetical protein
LDLVDVVRFRVHVGPGGSLGARVTERLSFYGGVHHTVYAGLPGPRCPRTYASPVGIESCKGLILAGVDATDDSPHPPNYSSTEIAVGAQVLVVGADAGIDLVEIADFFAGWFLVDLRRDDL